MIEDGKIPKANLQAPERFLSLKSEKECEGLLEKWVRFGFVFRAKLALKISFLIDKQGVKNFSIWVRFAKWRVRRWIFDGLLRRCRAHRDNRNAVSVNMAFLALNMGPVYRKNGKSEGSGELEK